MCYKKEAFVMKEIDFTDAAWESLYDAVDATVFLEQDAQLIYDSLKNRLRFISFGDYLRRYIYLKAEISEPFSTVELKEYQLIIRSAFSDNCTPASFDVTTCKLSALSKNWLTQQTVNRKVVFLLGFGLNMSVDDVNTFLTKALREPQINPKNPFEVICWYCYKNGYNYLKFEKLYNMYKNTCAKQKNQGIVYSEYTINFRNSMYSIADDDSLMDYLQKFKGDNNTSKISVTARGSFLQLYNIARQQVADIYNNQSQQQHSESMQKYIEKMNSSEKLYDYEKLSRIQKFKEHKKTYSINDITESDIEHIICASIPTDRHGNLTPSKASKLNSQFAGKRFSRQRIGEILAQKTEVTRFDLITLNFFVYSQMLDVYPQPKQRYSAFMKSTNEILEKCLMDKLYIQNPYECFVLMCILSVEPLGTYADVWELSYGE